MCTKILGRSCVYPQVVEEPAPVPDGLEGGWAPPARTWLSSWNPAIHTYTACNSAQWVPGCVDFDILQIGDGAASTGFVCPGAGDGDSAGIPDSVPALGSALPWRTPAAHAGFPRQHECAVGSHVFLGGGSPGRGGPPPAPCPAWQRHVTVCLWCHVSVPCCVAFSPELSGMQCLHT